MGLFVLFFGTKKKFNKIKHHTIIFGKEYFELLEKFLENTNYQKIYLFIFTDLLQQMLVLLLKAVIVFMH